MFRTLFERNGYKNDFVYDWNIAKETKTKNPYKYNLWMINELLNLSLNLKIKCLEDDNWTG